MPTTTRVTPRKSATAKSTASSARTRATPAQARAARHAAIAKAKTLAPEVPARIGSTPATRFRGDGDVFGRLVEDHDRHRALLAMIDATHGRSHERVALFEELTRELKGHAAAEEQALWSTVLRDPATTEDARHAVAEHKEIDELLADLAARDMAGSGWLRRFAGLREKYLHHLREEEQEQFVAAQKQLSPADLRYMRSVFARRKAAEKALAKVDKKIKLK